MSNEKIRDMIKKILEDKKAIDLNVIDVKDKTTIADYFVICSGQSDTQVKALVDYVDTILEKEHEIKPLRKESMKSGNWSVLDYGGVIVHVFNEESREKYSLDLFWESKSRE